MLGWQLPAAARGSEVGDERGDVHLPGDGTGRENEARGGQSPLAPAAGNVDFENAVQGTAAKTTSAEMGLGGDEATALTNTTLGDVRTGAAAEAGLGCRCEVGTREKGGKWTMGS